MNKNNCLKGVLPDFICLFPKRRSFEPGTVNQVLTVHCLPAILANWLTPVAAATNYHPTKEKIRVAAKRG
jgi:hypothetical protein